VETCSLTTSPAILADSSWLCYIITTHHKRGSRTQTASSPSGKSPIGFLPRMLCAYFEIGPCCLYAIVVEIKKETAGHVDTVIAEYNFCNRVAKKVTEIVHVK